jgi:hypothetical protein
VTCSFTSAGSSTSTTINLPANGTATATLYIDTTAPINGMVVTHRQPGGFNWPNGSAWSGTGRRTIALACLACITLMLVGGAVLTGAAEEQWRGR